MTWIYPLLISRVVDDNDQILSRWPQGFYEDSFQKPHKSPVFEVLKNSSELEIRRTSFSFWKLTFVVGADKFSHNWWKPRETTFSNYSKAVSHLYTWFSHWRLFWSLTRLRAQFQAFLGLRPYSTGPPAMKSFVQKWQRRCLLCLIISAMDRVCVVQQ